MTLDKQYWNELYRAGKTGWDIGSISSPLKAYIDQIKNKNITVLIPGGGNSHEAFYLCQSGFSNVTVLDIASTVIKRLQEKIEENNYNLTVIEQNFFEHAGQYDLILEQTFFCALDPSLRENYVKQMHRLLGENGKLAGVLFNRTFAGGPPFGGTVKEYEALFSPYFHFHTWAACYNSIPPRAGAEWFMILKKK